MKGISKQFEFGDHKTQEYAKSLPHPYKFEIESFDNSVDDLTFDSVVPQKYKTLEETPFLFVDSSESLHEMAAHLATSSEIAIDLEAHNIRSY